MKQLLFFFLLSLPTLAQKTFFIKDAATNKGIPYVSIFTSDGTFKINTEPTGSFSVPDEFLGNTFVFDAVGYESKQEELADVVLLEPKSELLEELVITPRLGTREINVGKIDKKKEGYYFFSEHSFLQGSEFRIKDDRNRFIKEIHVRTNSKINNAKFAVRIYNSNAGGLPNELINEAPIIINAKKGRGTSTINIEDLKIYVDSESFFVIFEQLYIEQNSRMIKWEDNKMVKIYEPKIGITPSEESFTWFLSREKGWKKAGMPTDPEYYTKEKYFNYQIEVTLTN